MWPFKQKKVSANKPVLVMIRSEGQPISDDTRLCRILDLAEVHRKTGNKTYRVQTFGFPKGLRQNLDTLMGPTDPKLQLKMDAIAMREQHAPDYKGPLSYCTVGDSAIGGNHLVVICEP